MVESAGLRRTVGQADEVRATGGDLEVVFWALPESTDGDLLVTVAGPCLEAPEAARDDFAARVGPDEGLD